MRTWRFPGSPRRSQPGTGTSPASRRLALAVLAAAALGSLTLLATAGRAAQTAQPPPAARRDAQNAYEPRTGPGAGQVMLAKFAGDWDVVKTFYPQNPQKGEPVRTTGECRQTMVHGGLYLESDFTFADKDGGKTTGTGISGFDAKSGRFTTVWFDSRSTTMSMRQSEGTFDGKEIILYVAALGGSSPEHRSITRTHLEEDGRVLIHRHYLVQPDGKERLMMELRLTRKGASPGHS